MVSLLQHAADWDNLRAAWTRVLANRGCAGADGVTIATFARDLDVHLSEAREALESGYHQPFPLMVAEIPKPSGRIRRLAVPTVFDRLVQTALHLVLSPILDPTFEDQSFAYRPDRSWQDALRRVREIRDRGYLWVFDADIHGFFDCVDHDHLLEVLARALPDEPLWRMLRRFPGSAEGPAETPSRSQAPTPGPRTVSGHPCRIATPSHLRAAPILVRGPARSEQRRSSPGRARTTDASPRTSRASGARHTQGRVGRLRTGRLGGAVMPVLYVARQGATLRKRGDRIAVRMEGVSLYECPIKRLDGVVLVGNVQVSSQAMRYLASRGVEVSLMTFGGRLVARIEPPLSRNVALQVAQYALAQDLSYALDVAHGIFEKRVQGGHHREPVALGSSAETWEQRWRRQAAAMARAIRERVPYRPGSGVEDQAVLQDSEASRLASGGQRP